MKSDVVLVTTNFQPSMTILSARDDVDDAGVRLGRHHTWQARKDFRLLLSIRETEICLRRKPAIKKTAPTMYTNSETSKWSEPRNCAV